jgi:acetolactate synthase small subunit
MKKQFVFSNARKALIRVSLATFLFTNAAVAFAGGGKVEEPFVTVKYIGATDDRAQFQLDLIADGDETYLLAVQDETGTYLYKEKVNAKTLTKKFEWFNADINTSKLVFSVTGLKSKKTQVFEVNSEVRTVRDVVISKR